MPKTGKNLQKTAASIIVGILIYGLVGSLFTAAGIAIYDNFPQEVFPIEGQDFKFTVRNNAPFSYPGVNLPIAVFLEISDNTGPVECGVWTPKGLVSPKDYWLDLGSIDQGKDKDVTFRITPHRNNFTITARSYVKIFEVKIPSATKNVRIVFVRSASQYQELYRVERTW